MTTYFVTTGHTIIETDGTADGDVLWTDSMRIPRKGRLWHDTRAGAVACVRERLARAIADAEDGVADAEARLAAYRDRLAHLRSIDKEMGA